MTFRIRYTSYRSDNHGRPVRYEQHDFDTADQVTAAMRALTADLTVIRASWERIGSRRAGTHPPAAAETSEDMGGLLERFAFGEPVGEVPHEMVERNVIQKGTTR